jgi:cytidylate kinase
MSNKNYVIAIDGPAGAGKSTIAKQLADVLNFTFVNSGGLYRCLAIALKNISLENTEDVEAIINSSKIIQEKNSFFLNDLDVTTECYSKEIAGLVPFIAKIPCVGKKIIDIRREIAKTASIVVEGRETTSVVFPDANLKVYLDASVQVRAQRR